MRGEKKRGSKRKKSFDTAEIPLWLDDYIDIFSDFDPRPYTHRALSQDFLEEAERASRDKEEGNIELTFLVPKSKRRVNHEPLIKNRLKEHFRKHFNRIKKEVSDIRWEGLFFILFGIIIMFIATLILFKYSDAHLFTSFLIVFLEPAGWFLFWEGLDLVIFKPHTHYKNLSFYNKMSKCKIFFRSY